MHSITPPSSTTGSSATLTRVVADNLEGLLTYASHVAGDSANPWEIVRTGLTKLVRSPLPAGEEASVAVIYKAVTRSALSASEKGSMRKTLALAQLKGRGRRSGQSDPARRVARMAPLGRAALLLRELAGLPYRQIAIALETTPDAACRAVAAARRDFGGLYLENSL